MTRLAALVVMTLVSGSGALAACGAATRPSGGDGDIDGDVDAGGDGDSDGDADADAACDEQSAGQTADAVIQGMAFAPAFLEITTGTRVRWTNHDAVEHAVTEGTPAAGSHLWDSGALSPGETFERTFCEVGEWTYFDAVHANVIQGAVVRVR